MVGLNPALRLSLKGYFKPFNFAIIWEVMGIGIPASIESVLFNGGKLLTQMFVAGMGTNVIAGNFIAFSVASLINLPGTPSALPRRSLPASGWEKGRLVRLNSRPGTYFGCRRLF
ncbi:MATE family multidrug exporter [Klebsiella pneumoniae]|nr:MATE family multidrug exporter [Klebsiella pneumoniae]